MSVYKTDDDFPSIIIVCSCGLSSHQLQITWLEDIAEFSLQPHLVTWKNVFRRAWSALLYVLGHKSRYGEFDESLIGKRDARKIARFLLDHAEGD